MHCTRCGTRCLPDDAFCPECGSPLQRGAAAAQAQTQAPEQNMPLSLVHYTPIVVLVSVEIVWDLIDAALHLHRSTLSTMVTVATSVAYMWLSYQNTSAAKEYVDSSRREAIQAYFVATVIITSLALIVVAIATTHSPARLGLLLALLIAHLVSLGWRDKVIMDNWWGFSLNTRMYLLQLALQIVWGFAFP